MKPNSIQAQYLIFKARNKDPEAYSQVYDLYIDRIYRFVFFKINNQEEAQDITSEVFLKTWHYIIDGKEIKNLNALFYKIARNLVIDYYRKASQKDISLEDLVNGADSLIPDKELAHNGQDNLDKKIQLEKIQDKLLGLKEEYREVIILRFVEGLSINEIAEIVDKKNGAVRVILFRA
ncbi:MAG: RNA polymerase sigma factor, partial [Candidatus Parcubacteria bacterium]|nr:RNA polymerase sigma factor [Candidatus Parcubacteria bacterium]